ncbi:MAG: glycosyltransferase [bacterium]|nr:glycosyltransferase [bacterium]
MLKTKARKKILYLVTQSDFGGAQRYVYDLAANLKDQFNIVVASGEQKNGELKQKLEKANIRHIYISHLKRNILPLHDVLALFQLIRLIKKERPNIIHLNSSKISVLGSFAAWWNNVPKVIYSCHGGGAFTEDIPKWQQYLYKIFEKLTAQFKTDFICFLESDKKNLVKLKIASPSKISLINNGIR